MGDGEGKWGMGNLRISGCRYVNVYLGCSVGRKGKQFKKKQKSHPKKKGGGKGGGGDSSGE